MKENSPSKREPSFLTSSEGKKILFFTFLLIFVVGMMLYSYYTKTSTSWSDLLTSKSFEDQEIVGSDPYQTILLDLRNIDNAEFTRKRKQHTSSAPSPSELKKGIPDARGQILPFKGKIKRRPIRLEPIPDQSTAVHVLQIQNKKKKLTYSIHLIFPPERPLKKGTTVSGHGVYLTTKSNSIQKNATNGDKSTPLIYLMARKVTVHNEPNQEEESASDSKSNASSADPSSNSSAKDRALSPPKSYSDQETVTSYWNGLLSSLDRVTKLKPKDDLFKRMVSELETVELSDLSSWSDPHVTPNTLKEEPARPHRGKVVSFRGKYIQRYKKELFGGPQDRDFVWEYWIRDQNNHLTYTFYSFNKANFDPERGTPVKGNGVYLNKQTYELLNPRRAGDQTVKQGRTVVLIGAGLKPHFNPTASGNKSTVHWVQYILGGLIVLTLGIFFVMVYISLSGDEEERAERLRNVRNRKPAPDLPNESSVDDESSSSEPGH